jgi:hypothetical protein
VTTAVLILVAVAAGPDGLAHDDYYVRETAQAWLSATLTTTEARRLQALSTDPEARLRWPHVLWAVVNRDMDRLAHSCGGYAPADRVTYPDYWPPEPGSRPWGSLGEKWPREFWQLSARYCDCADRPEDYYNGYVVRPTPAEQSARTREALLRYVMRTDDWMGAAAVLRSRKRDY